MNTAFIGLILLIAIALVGWVIAELKYRAIHFTHSEEEREEEELLYKEHAEHDFKEMNIRDIIRTNSTKGFNAV